MLFTDEGATDMDKNPLLNWMRKHMNLTPKIEGNKFWIKGPDPKGSNKLVWFATPLFVALVLVNVADIIFAVDSVPAIFAITQDPFIVYTSNIFAILGLRALYFALAAMIHRFHYLKYALALVLVFIGAKIILMMLGIKIPAVIALTVTFGLIAGGIFYSMYRTRGQGAV
jgi:tellurite resistance protein TerC